MFYILDNGKLIAFGANYNKLYHFVENYLSFVGGLPYGTHLFEGYDYSGYGDKLQMFVYPEKEDRVVSFYTNFS